MKRATNRTPLERIRAKAKRFAQELDKDGEQYFALWFTGEQPPKADFQFRIKNPRQIAAVFLLVAKQEPALQILLRHIAEQFTQEQQTQGPAVIAPTPKLILP